MRQSLFRTRFSRIWTDALGSPLLASTLVLLLAATAAAETGLPIPRFVSLRADEVNVRTGPGVRYPVDWVFKRRDLPVEIVAEFDTWRKIRDWQGTEGWVHQSMLSGRRTVVVTAQVRRLRREPAEDSAAVAMLEPGVIGALGRCRGAWCRIGAGGFSGWLKRDEFWGVLADEEPD